MKTLINILIWIPYVNIVTGLLNMMTYDKYNYDWFDNSEGLILLNVLYTGAYMIISFILLYHYG